MSYSMAFKTALAHANDDFGRYGEYGNDEMTEAGDMRAVGVNRSDTVEMANGALAEFHSDLMADGDKQAAALLTIIEMAVATGVHLERARWDH
jgi:hypothetical protein